MVLVVEVVGSVEEPAAMSVIISDSFVTTVRVSWIDEDAVKVVSETVVGLVPGGNDFGAAISSPHFNIF